MKLSPLCEHFGHFSSTTARSRVTSLTAPNLLPSGFMGSMPNLKKNVSPPSLNLSVDAPQRRHHVLHLPARRARRDQSLGALRRRRAVRRLDSVQIAAGVAVRHRAMSRSEPFECARTCRRPRLRPRTGRRSRARPTAAAVHCRRLFSPRKRRPGFQIGRVRLRSVSEQRHAYRARALVGARGRRCLGSRAAPRARHGGPRRRPRARPGSGERARRGWAGASCCGGSTARWASSTCGWRVGADGVALAQLVDAAYPDARVPLYRLDFATRHEHDRARNLEVVRATLDRLDLDVPLDGEGGVPRRLPRLRRGAPVAVPRRAARAPASATRGYDGRAHAGWRRWRNAGTSRARRKPGLALGGELGRPERGGDSSHAAAASAAAAAEDPDGDAPFSFSFRPRLSMDDGVAYSDGGRTAGADSR